MARIADALKKAQTERRRTGTMETDTSAPRGVIAAALKESAALRTSIAEDTRPITIPDQMADISTPQKRKRAAEPEIDLISPAPHWDVHPTVVAVHEKNSPITEQYRAARTWLMRRHTTGAKNCVAITSSVAREGKSVTTANLAVVMAEIRHLKVLAMDCDFRQGSLAKLFKMQASPGLSDVLAGRASLESAIQATPMGNLFLLSSGGCQELNSAELLNSTSAARVFETVRDRFDYVMVDTPPVQCLSDVGVIGAHCTGIILVVRMNKTPAHLVRQSAHWLQANNLNVLGCIAADCSARGARYEYDATDHD